MFLELLAQGAAQQSPSGVVTAYGSNYLKLSDGHILQWATGTPPTSSTTPTTSIAYPQAITGSVSCVLVGTQVPASLQNGSSYNDSNNFYILESATNTQANLFQCALGGGPVLDSNLLPTILVVGWNGTGADPGFALLGNQLLLQWVQGSAAIQPNAQATLNWPKAFPTSFLTAGVTSVNASPQSASGVLCVNSGNLTGVTVGNAYGVSTAADNQPLTPWVLGIGY